MSQDETTADSMADGEPASRADVVLPDSRRVRVRSIHHDDAPRLLQAFERLGDESRYRRFLSPTNRLSTRMVDYLTSIDHQFHEALVAVDEAGDIVGVARLIRSPENPRSAEIAVTVIDDWQSDGVGTVLMQRLIQRARELGIAAFTGDVLSENRKMHELLRQFGRLQITHSEAGVEAFLLPISGGDRAAARPAP